ncbi:MAG: hypothetical protein ACJA0N_002053 [Pseudohongiellaceae bacterium]
MNKTFFVLIAVLLAGLTACVGVETEHTDFTIFDNTQYKRYSWVTESLSSTSSSRKAAYTVDNSIRSSLNRLLRDKGYQLVVKDRAEFFIDYRFSRTISIDQGDPMATPTALQGAWDTSSSMSNPGFANDFVPEQIFKNHLDFSMVDSGTKKPLWRGTASKILEENSYEPEKVERVITKAVAKLFKDFPNR